jgi:hypothetical protein
MIDPATGWFEVVRVNGKSSAECANELEIAWLNRYPLPTEVVSTAVQNSKVNYRE